MTKWLAPKGDRTNHPDLLIEDGKFWIVRQDGSRVEVTDEQFRAWEYTPKPADGADLAAPPSSVYVLGYSPSNDTIWGVYSSMEAVDDARKALAELHGLQGSVGWVEEVPLRTSGSLPEFPFVG